MTEIALRRGAADAEDDDGGEGSEKTQHTLPWPLHTNTLGSKHQALGLSVSFGQIGALRLIRLFR